MSGDASYPYILHNAAHLGFPASPSNSHNARSQPAFHVTVTF